MKKDCKKELHDIAIIKEFIDNVFGYKITSTNIDDAIKEVSEVFRMSDDEDEFK